MAGIPAEELSETFWAQRSLHVIGNYKHFEERNEARLLQRQQNLGREEQEKRQFFAANSHLLNFDLSSKTRNNHKVISDLTFWIKYCAWSYCSMCYSMTAEKLLPKYGRKPNLKQTSTCSCTEKRYNVPLPSLIPEPLLNLSTADICILRPIDLHCGAYERHGFGHRQKIGKCQNKKLHGTKKYQCTNECDWTVVIACPTGVLARMYSNKFSSPNLHADTVHSCFCIPVNTSERPKVNHSLSCYNLINSIRRIIHDFHKHCKTCTYNSV